MDNFSPVEALFTARAIPLNPTPGSIWTSSEPEVMQEFIDTLIENGVPTTLRDTRGKEIDGACGQLAAAE